jgi:two-component system chemotaxis response regulator CheB
MRPIRVFIVDDSITVRRMLSDALAEDPELEVVGSAANGALALTLIPRLSPDLVILDIDMPVLDGLETMGRLRPLFPRLPVIVFSSSTSHGAETTLQALWLGANDYVQKPSSFSSGSASHVVEAELMPRIKALARREPRSAQESAGTGRREAAAPRAGPASLSSPHAAIIAIGASTGGPRALAQILADLPRDLEAPVLVVQHMPPVFTRHLADGLTVQGELPVREAVHGIRVQPGVVWLAPGDHHLEIERRGGELRLLLTQAAPENACRPSVNPLFRSVAETYGASALAIILTGMGQDGLQGCERVRELGGQVIAQDESTSVVWGMPGQVVRAGLAHRVMPLDEIAGEIVRRARPGRGRDVREAA